MATSTITRKPVDTRVRTGEICPQSGVWKANSKPSATLSLTQGDRTPLHNNGSVIWELVSYE